MGQIRQNVIKPISGIYDFANDPSGGVIGVVRLGAFLPPRTTVIQAWTRNPILFADGGAGAEVSFGWLDSANIITQPVQFHPQTVIAAYTAAPIWTGINFFTNPFFKSEGLELVMVIAAADITAGRCIITLMTVTQN